MAGRCDGCLQEGVRLKGKKDGDRERREAYFHLIFPPPSTSAQLCSTCGEDGTGPAGGNMLNIALRSNYKTTITLRHALYLNTITWRLRMDNPLKPDQRKSEF